MLFSGTADAVKERQDWGHRMGWLNLIEEQEEIIVKLQHGALILNLLYSQWTPWEMNQLV